MALMSSLIASFSFEQALDAACHRAVTSAMELRSRRLLKISEAAEYIALSRRELYNMISNNELPVVSDGKCKMLDIRDLDTWIERNKK